MGEPGVWGWPLQNVPVRDGRYALPLLARECPDGLHSVPFTLWARGQGQAVHLDRVGYRLDLEAPEPRGRPSDGLLECKLALGTLSGVVLSAGARVPDATPVEARIGPGTWPGR